MNIAGSRKSTRFGAFTGVQKLVARAMARDLRVFVVPGPELARAHGLDITQSGMRLAHTPRHAGVLLIIGPLSKKMREAATIIYAQMPRPRVIVALGSGDLAPLPPADVSAPLTPKGLTRSLVDIRQIIASSAFAGETSDFKAPALEVRIEYTCPMHPEIIRDEPGNCPKCGMTLMPREAGAIDPHAGHDMGAMEMPSSMPEAVRHEDHTAHKETAETAAQYTCPMHPEVLSDTPGSCPKCGMHLVAVEGGEESGHAGHSGHKHGHGHKMAEDTPAQYTCPMHPEVLSDTPGSCPKCGMHLVAVETDTETGHGDHSGHAGHSGHGGGGTVAGIEPQFMSMVDLTKDQPRSSDGLQMDWIPVAFGPFFPGLPGGLELEFMLDGDTVAGAEIGTLVAMQSELVHAPQSVSDFVAKLAASMPLSPVSYEVLAMRALEDAAGVQPDGAAGRARVAVLERERIASHLNWLTQAGAQAGFGWMADRAAQFQLGVQDGDADRIAALTPALSGFLARIQSMRMLRARLKNIARIDAHARASGPVARAQGASGDLRRDDPIYGALGFVAAAQAGGDAWARFMLRCDEIRHSLHLIASAGEITPPVLAEIGVASGKGTSAIETPRGVARLDVQLEGGMVVAANLETPSMLHAGLIEGVTAQQELGDALVAVASLDISPWEMGDGQLGSGAP